MGAAAAAAAPSSLSPLAGGPDDSGTGSGTFFGHFGFRSGISPRCFTRAADNFCRVALAKHNTARPQRLSGLRLDRFH